MRVRVRVYMCACVHVCVCACVCVCVGLAPNASLSEIKLCTVLHLTDEQEALVAATVTIQSGEALPSPNSKGLRSNHASCERASLFVSEETAVLRWQEVVSIGCCAALPDRDRQRQAETETHSHSHTHTNTHSHACTLTRACFWCSDWIGTCDIKLHIGGWTRDVPIRCK